MNKKHTTNIIKFEKVSKEQYEKDAKKLLFEINESTYDDILLPKRATIASAGYDFYLPTEIKLEPGKNIIIPTGIRCKMNQDIVLQIFPRSSLAFKYRLQLDNTVGIIDSDYYNATNEGHIMIKLSNNSIDNKELYLEKGSAFVQGIFLKYYTTIDDDTTENRTGGLGSTNK